MPLLTFSIFWNGSIVRNDLAIRNVISPPVSVATSSENIFKLLAWSEARGEKGLISNIISAQIKFAKRQGHNKTLENKEKCNIFFKVFIDPFLQSLNAVLNIYSLRFYYIIETYVSKSKKLNFVCSIFPARISQIHLSLTNLNGNTIFTAIDGRVIIELLCIPKNKKLSEKEKLDLALYEHTSYFDDRNKHLIIDLVSTNLHPKAPHLTDFSVDLLEPLIEFSSL